MQEILQMMGPNTEVNKRILKQIDNDRQIQEEAVKSKIH